MRVPMRIASALAAATLLTNLYACTGDPPRNGSRGDGDGDGGGKPSASDSAKPGKPAGFSLVATGDLLPHNNVIRQAAEQSKGGGHDFSTMLAAAKPLARSADLAICHMETIYGAKGGPFSGYPAFQTPPQLAQDVKDLGYDGCSTASNHTLDNGTAGVRRTLDAMDRAGLKHSGSARTAPERDRPVLLKAGGASVGHLAYTYGTNGIPMPQGKPWTVNLIDPKRIVADARRLRRAGADVVVVSVHWGTEWQQAPDRQQLSVAEELTRSRAADGDRDVDLILGTHAHVPQAYEKVNGTWVVYGMGDQLAGPMNDPRGAMGSAARFTFRPPAEGGKRWRVVRAEFVPYLIDLQPRVRLTDLAAPRPEGSARARAHRLIRAAVLSRGAAKDGLREGRPEGRSEGGAHH